MSILFTPFKLGNIVIKNRFIHSACEDNLSDGNGQVTDAIIKKNRTLAKNEVGLIIWSHLSVHPSGRTKKYQSEIHSDDMIPGLKKVVDAVHEEGGRIVFQLGHAGTQTSEDVTGRALMGPATMDEAQIHDVIQAFKDSAGRAAEAGADGIQLHAAHGYLLNQFLSPFFNHREDKWGGSDNNRFRLLKEIILEIKNNLPPDMLILVKLNSNDYTSKEGITPPLAVSYAKGLRDLSIHGMEVSCGTSFGSTWNMCRGDVPVKEMVKGFPESKQSKIEAFYKKMVGRFELDGPYNLEATKTIRPVFGDIPLFAVGGWRTLSNMEEAVDKGHTDLISMCRPFIREPGIVKRFRQGKTDMVSCKNCNKCLAALVNNIPVRCYYKGFPG